MRLISKSISMGGISVGLGSALTLFRIERIKEIKGVKILSVRTSQLVYKFYEKFGMEIREIVKDYWDKGFDLYRLDCDISSTITKD